jgi:pantoate--beta-alanine ligase
MTVATTKQELKEKLIEWRQQDHHVALVPTMGNLHAGHLSLVELARESAEKVVISIFVNPTQFGKDEDFDEYPRNLKLDIQRLKKSTADLIFAPNVETMYPLGLENATSILVPKITENFCGASRPGHFDGVTSVVARLFTLVQPDAAIFGQKDYQQQLAIRHMSLDLNLPIKIITGKTMREDDGLAMSSRNQYLSDDERVNAPMLYEVLSDTAERLQSGCRDYKEQESRSIKVLSDAGFSVEYFSIRRAQNLKAPDRDCDELVVLVAVKLGNARLIDNVVVTI